MTRNEIRDLENRPPLNGGDELTVQSNLAPISFIMDEVNPDVEIWPDNVETVQCLIGLSTNGDRE